MMEKEIKSGKLILDEFFKEIKTDEKLDIGTVSAITDLYEADKLSDNNLTNALLKLREEKNEGKN